MNTDDSLIKRHFEDLSRRAYRQGIDAFSGFLSMHEQALLQSVIPNLEESSVSLFGGTENCERKMVGFRGGGVPPPDDVFPIACLLMRPLNKKFSDALTHRDFLGALMNLGIERNMIGDIFVFEQSAYLFMTRAMAPYVAENLCRAKHTSISCSLVPLSSVPADLLCVKKTVLIQAESERLDTVIAKVFHLSREESQSLFLHEKVFVNSVSTARCSKAAAENDIISVRGYGRFCYKGIVGYSKKGKLNLEVETYES